MIIKKSNKHLLTGKPGLSRPAAVVPWAMTNPKQFKEISRAAAAEAKRRPEFFVPADERRRVRFLDADAIASFRGYDLPGRSGRYELYVQPADGEPNLFESALDLRSKVVFLFRVIDVDGYQKDGKKYTNLPRFYRVGNRIYDQIMLTVSTSGTPLNKADMIIARSGAGKNTAYQFVQRPPSPLSPGALKASQNFPNWLEYYSPPSYKEQKQIVAARGGSTEEDDDTED